VDVGYVGRVEEEGTASVVAAMTEADAGDELDCVGPAKSQYRRCSPAESAGEVGAEPNSEAVVLPNGINRGKRAAGDGDGPEGSEQSTLNVNPEAPGWTKRLVPASSLCQTTRINK
jgi:hypothetical protein